RDVRRERLEQQRHGSTGFLEERLVPTCRLPAELLHGVQELHGRGDGGVEVEALLDVEGDAFDGLVDLAPQRCAPRVGRPVLPFRHGRSSLIGGTRYEQPPDLLEKAETPFYA